MASFVPSSAETIIDQELYTRARLTEVACSECLATVGVKKNSEHHTSIQWNSASQSQCPQSRPVHQSCPRLLASIEAAVADGRLSIGAEDGY